MSKLIKIEELSAVGAELDDRELEAVAGGLPPVGCGCGSSKTVYVDNHTDTDRDF